MISSPNRDLLTRVARRLEPLLEQLVFVGGQVTELLITDPVAVHVRPTATVGAELPAPPSAHPANALLPPIPPPQA